MFEIIVLAVNVGLPCAVMAAGLLLVRLFVLRRNAGSGASGRAQPPELLSPGGPAWPHRVALSCCSLMAALAIWLAFGMRLEFALWPEDAWMRFPNAVALVGLASAAGSWLPHYLRWTLNACATFAAAYWVFPQGDAWAFLLPSRTIWIACMALSCSLGWWLVDRRQPRAAGILGLGWIPLFAAAAFLTIQSFAKITEPLLAISAVMGCASLATLVWQEHKWVASVTGPCLMGLSLAVASAQFNSFLGWPDSLSWLAMTAPTVAALLTYPLCLGQPTAADKPQASGQWSHWAYVIAVVVVCIGLAGLIAGITQSFSSELGGEDW